MASIDDFVIKLDAAVLQNVATLRARLAAAMWENRRLRRELAQARGVLEWVRYVDRVHAEDDYLAAKTQLNAIPDAMSQSDMLKARKLQMIRRIVDDACAEAGDADVSGAINWGDLGCADVGTKNDGYYAVIEEASPDAWELCQFVADRLAAAGIDNVDVSTEW